ncbi:MAG: FkbM family methyltransferase, partial [Gemmatimonadota bacterium]|nr:FkbM family methyltransferase [Gemmatimonadota bacterium]
DLTFFRDKIDYLLTRIPNLYLALEERREWVNWDKRVYLSFVSRGDVVLDVGANVGAHTVFLSHLVGSSGKVIAFEPLPPNLAKLRELVARRARFDNIEVVAAAVGNPDPSTTEVSLHAPGSDYTQASLATQTAGSWSAHQDVKVFQCPITSIDLDTSLRRLERLDFLKLDIEGGEMPSLLGARKTISRFGPLIYCEVYRRWTEAFRYSPTDLMSVVLSLGYREARAIVDGRVHSHLLESPLPDYWFDNSSDVLFFRDIHREMVRRFDSRYLREGD